MDRYSVINLYSIFINNYQFTYISWLKTKYNKYSADFWETLPVTNAEERGVSSLLNLLHGIIINLLIYLKMIKYRPDSFKKFPAMCVFVSVCVCVCVCVCVYV